MQFGGFSNRGAATELGLSDLKRVFGWNSRVGDVGRSSGTAGDETDDVGVLAQPAVTSNLEQIRSLSWVRHQDTPEQVSGVRCDVFGESEGSRDDVLIKQIDVVAFGVRWIVVEGEVAGKHCILFLV